MNDSRSLGFVSIAIPPIDGRPAAVEQVRYDNFVKNLLKPQTRQLMCLHAALGICGEAGEFADAIKKEHIYGKVLDRTLLIEELGDLRFYIQAAMNLYGISETEILQANADKLATRYVGLKYSDEAAIARADKTGETIQDIINETLSETSSTSPRP